MAVGGILRARPRPKKERKPKPACVFEWFVGTLSGSALELVAGCDRVAITHVGDERIEERTRDPRRRLVANIGDCLILCGPSVAETVGAKVLRVEQDGYRERLHLRLSEPIANSRVHVLKVRNPSVSADRSKPARPGNSPAIVGTENLKRSA